MFARTNRLLLRPGWMEDATALTAALNDPAVARMTRGIPTPFTLADAEAHIARQQDATVPDLLMFARTRGAPRLVGGVGLTGASARKPMLSYWVARDHWGLGYATEAAAALVSIAFHGLRIGELQAENFIDNPGSERVLRKLGFFPTGLRVDRPCVARAEDVPCQQYRMVSEVTHCGEGHPLAA
ncbi:GNAT family N-acetyltransferase [Sphingomonas sp. ID0503]|uniref:GNAT family N-acetyltransferase n=1 Tax=Sphingomonas sp. ID0503 TaxID=3399691 RepID=UPI003AFB3945